MIISNLKPFQEEVIGVVMETFKPFYPQESEEWFREQIKDVDLFLSIGYLKEDKLVGVYLLRKKNFESTEGVGLCGEALAIIPSFQRKGIASRMLKYVSLTNSDCDYLWGCQAKRLNNLGFWLKTRELVKEDDEHYYTLQRFSR